MAKGIVRVVDGNKFYMQIEPQGGGSLLTVSRQVIEAVEPLDIEMGDWVEYEVDNDGNISRIKKLN